MNIIIKSKNTNYSSISRALMNIILSQTKESISQYKEHGYCDFARVLAINENGKKLYLQITHHFLTIMMVDVIIDLHYLLIT